jgi:hypothetical protein
VSAGIVLVIAGIWVATQVLGGDALQRTGVISSSDSSSTVTPDPNFRTVPPGSVPPGATVPGSGGTLQDVPPGFNGLPNGGNF